MSNTAPAFKPVARIGFFGPNGYHGDRRHGSNLWDAGIRASLEYAEAEAVALPEKIEGKRVSNLLANVDGLVVTGHDACHFRHTDMEELFQYCRKNAIPVLAIDRGMHAMNTAFGGTTMIDMGREAPDMLQHRHPPERGLRHGLVVEEFSRLAKLYGEGEIIVNSEHSQAVGRVARAFKVGARAMDGMVESIETNPEDPWWALGIQWQPACATSSGLDIQIFRCHIEKARARAAAPRARAA
ncbi:MAG: gamma-glutamyl-gamma-aminobutyrate hydrolase family protein [Planctomycetes bacterium]|nr:gamma-glutamyl-gamma-aminobutyrate hydrolase family protein [Planctomycetota bacterium]